MNDTKLWFDYIAEGNLEKIKEMVNNGFDVNTKDSDGISGLTMSSFMGNSSVESYLTKQGAK